IVIIPIVIMLIVIMPSSGCDAYTVDGGSVDVITPPSMTRPKYLPFKQSPASKSATGTTFFTFSPMRRATQSRSTHLYQRHPQAPARPA
ncbi:MAG: hypothetical protein ACKPKO_02145, partial [Candidatus Fonsibacter sp.]